MIIKSRYKNRWLYMKKMQNFVDNKIEGKEFSDWFLSQRSQDIDKDKKLISSKERLVLDKLMKQAIKKEITEEQYEKEVNKIIWPFNNLFLDIYDELQAVDIEDFWPRDDEAFEEDINIDEEEFRKRVKEKLRILEENKEKW
jgi:hypothetical protein